MKSVSFVCMSEEYVYIIRVYTCTDVYNKQVQVREIDVSLTLVHLHVGNGLPLVHGDEPPRLVLAIALLAAAAQVYDQLRPVAAQGAEDGVEAGLAELAAREEEGRDDDLLKQFATSK